MDTSTPTDRDKLISVIEALLSEEIGKIEGTTKTAVILEPSGNRAAPNPSVRGIKVCIDRLPYTDRNGPTLQGSQHCHAGHWKVLLTQYDLSDRGLARWDSAIQKMRMRFAHADEVLIQGDGKAFPQCRYRLKFTQILSGV